MGRYKGRLISAVGPSTSNTKYTGSASGFWSLSEAVLYKTNSLWPKGLSVPDAPTISSVTGGNAQASVAFTAPADNGGTAITSYTATSNPGNISASGNSSPIVVSGLTNGTSYTFNVYAMNSQGTGFVAVSSSVIPTALISNLTAIAYGASLTGLTTPINVVGDSTYTYLAVAATYTSRPQGILVIKFNTSTRAISWASFITGSSLSTLDESFGGFILSGSTLYISYTYYPSSNGYRTYSQIVSLDAVNGTSASMKQDFAPANTYSGVNITCLVALTDGRFVASGSYTPYNGSYYPIYAPMCIYSSSGGFLNGDFPTGGYFDSVVSGVGYSTTVYTLAYGQDVSTDNYYARIQKIIPSTLSYTNSALIGIGYTGRHLYSSVIVGNASETAIYVTGYTYDGSNYWTILIKLTGSSLQTISWAVQYIGSPNDMVIDSDENLYILSDANTITKFNSSGVIQWSRSLGSGLNSSQRLRVTGTELLVFSANLTYTQLGVLNLPKDGSKLGSFTVGSMSYAISNAGIAPTSALSSLTNVTKSVSSYASPPTLGSSGIPTLNLLTSGFSVTSTTATV